MATLEGNPRLRTRQSTSAWVPFPALRRPKFLDIPERGRERFRPGGLVPPEVVTCIHTYGASYGAPVLYSQILSTWTNRGPDHT